MTTRTTRRAIESDDELLRSEGDSAEFSVEFDDSSIVDKDDLLTSEQLLSPVANDYDERLQAAQQQLQALRQQQEEIEHQKRELEDLNEKQRSFVTGRSDLSNKLSRAIAMLEREASEARKKAESFDAAREGFEVHFKTINALRPEEWDRAELKNDLARALTVIERARQDFDRQSGEILSLQKSADSELSSKSSRENASPSAAAKGSAPLFPTNFKQCFMLGLAFTLPLVILGTIGLLISLIF
ncbi:MAG: chromosome segregation ATPase [Verrucomicrobiales bacterium]|jgi:chromosome segregation ATPase